MNVAIVNDMSLAVEALRRAVTSGNRHRIVWAAANGREAVEKCRAQRPDLVLMDLIMPEMDGVEATRRIMQASPCPILIVTSSVDENAALVFTAMGFGALDAVNTPLLGFDESGAGIKALLDKIRIIEMLTQPAAVRSAARAGAVAARAIDEPELVAIGASSGGPSALAELLGQLPADFPVPVVAVQHIDAQFTGEFAFWLGKQVALAVTTVEKPVAPRGGTVYLAGRDAHLVLDARGMLTYAEESGELFYRPSVDVFFDSVCERLRGRCIAALLTGMGRDGAEGLLRLRQNGHVTLAQSRETSAVYGMPRAAVELNAAAHVMSPAEIGAFIRRAIARRAAPPFPANELQKAPRA